MLRRVVWYQDGKRGAKRLNILGFCSLALSGRLMCNTLHYGWLLITGCSENSHFATKTIGAESKWGNGGEKI